MVMKQTIENAVDFMGGSVHAVGEFAKGAGWLVFALFRNFPFAMIGMLLGLTIAWGVIHADSRSAPTIQRQIVQHDQTNGVAYWMMQENGENPSGFLEMDGFGNKEQKADFLAALRFCSANKSFTGCDKVIEAADMPNF
jgi:hypothetical protein